MYISFEMESSANSNVSGALVNLVYSSPKTELVYSTALLSRTNQTLVLFYSVGCSSPVQFSSVAFNSVQFSSVQNTVLFLWKNVTCGATT